MLIGSPSGAHYDLSSALWTSWNPDWQCAAARFDGGWTLEERIPFDEFAQPKQFFATPQTGETWRVQLYRKKTNPEEVSAWSREDNSGPVNSLVFRGKKSGNVVPSAEKTGTDTFFTERSGMLEFVVKGFTTGPVDGTCTISRNGKNIRTVSAQATEPSPCIIDFPYMLPEGGDYRFSVELKNAGRVFYTARAVKQLSPMNETVEALEKETGSARKFLARDSHPAFAGIRQRLQEFTLKIHDVRQQLKTAGSLNASGLATLSDKIAKLAEEWKPLEIDVKLTRLYPGKNPKKLVFFAVGSATANEKIYRDTQYQGSLTAPLTLALAGNEYGSFQLAIIPFWRNLDNVSISFSPLKEPGGQVVPSDNFRWFIVNYVKLEPPPAYTGFVYTHQNEPDPLMPARPFTVSAGETGAVWVDLLLPEKTPEGLYTGMVTVTADGQSVSRTVKVQSYGFDIPRKNTLEVDCWFYPNYGWSSFYGGIAYNPELHAKHAEVLGRYRMSSFPEDWTFLCSQVPIFLETDGKFTFDWSRFDQYVQNAKRNNSTAFWSALSCNSGWSAYLNSPDVEITERATGWRITVGYIMQDKWKELGENDYMSRFYGKSYYKNPVYRDFLTAYVQHLKELGINNISYYELFDEVNQDPAPHTRWLAMIEHHTFFRKLVPDLHLLDFGLNPTLVIEGKSPIGLIDVWAPHLFQLDDAAILNATRERQTKHGEKFWTYTCTEKTDKEGNYTPYIFYNQPYIAARMHSWMAWYYHLDGFLIFALNGVPAANCRKTPDKRWPNSQWSDGADMGCGTLVYPGPDYQLIPGMRLANVRKGLEDYEYFALLRSEAKKLDPVRDAGLLKKVDQALQIDKNILSSVYIWTKDENLLEAKRAALAGLIREVRKTTVINNR